VIVKRPAHRLYPGQLKDQAHLSAIVSPEATIMADLFTQAKTILRSRGTNRIIFGQDLAHFFPGVPAECRILNEFLLVEGFRPGGEIFDLERDLQDFTYDRPVPEDYIFRPLKASETPALDEFMAATFPRRWRYDVCRKVDAETPGCVFVAERNGVIEGFALLHDWTAKMPIGGAVWRHSLGPNWGSLGPIGVSESIRGKGVGGALLGRALLHLKDLGVHRCIIDWTTLVDFYGKFGFEPVRRYLQYALPLE
jgi:predicted N-acetyltransferase YhbS